MADADFRISVVMPVYNAERFLAEAIESVLGQTFAPMELIIIDDGSTDGSAAVALGYGGVRYVRQPNLGQSEAQNHGVRLALGNFLAFLDADDVWLSNKLAMQVAAFEEDPSLQVVFGHVKQFAHAADGDTPGVIDPLRRILPAHIPGAMLIRRDAFDLTGEFSTRWRIGNSVEWYARALDAGLRSRMLQEVVYRRRIHNDNVGVREGQLRNDYLAVVKEALDRRRAAVRDRPGERRDSDAEPGDER